MANAKGRVFGVGGKLITPPKVESESGDKKLEVSTPKKTTRKTSKPKTDEK